MLWFSSDHHFFHANVIKYCKRPYETVEEMNESLILNWNKLVQPDDRAIVVGDFSMAFRPVETITPRLMGEKCLVLGNHDWAHPAHKKSRTPENREKWIAKYLEAGWDEVLLEKRFVLADGREVLISHLPYLEPESDECQRHHKFRPVDNGLVLLCGHIHEKWITRRTKKGSLMINVGVDAWHMKPVSEAAIIETIRDAGVS